MKKQFRSFKNARSFVRSLKLKNQPDWYDYCKSGNKPKNIPSSPWSIYKEWISLPDWLGNKNIASSLIEFRSFPEAREFIHSLDLKNQKEWRNYKNSNKRPVDIPKTPEIVYKNKGWKDLGDWLGTGTIASRKKLFKSYEEARKFVHTLKLKNQREWQKYAKSDKKPNDIPSTPSRHYKNEWKGWGDWLGTKNLSNILKSNQWKNFHESKLEMRKLAKLYDLKTIDDFNRAKRTGLIPDYIPAHPWDVYSKKRKNEETI